MGGSTAIRVLTPVQGQIQLTVNQGMAARRDIGEKHSHLTILDLSRHATILHSDACRFVTPLGKTGFIDDQDD
jgi:hypothetical protein